jgi:DNA-binding transcriptional ArsR family regulator
MVEDREFDAIFQALAHESRRRMLDIVRDHPGIGVGALAERFDVTRIAVMKHLAVLESARLITSDKEGRTRRLYFNAAPIRMIYDRWTDDLSGYFAGEITRIKRLAEARTKRDLKRETKR